ncbi:signal transduction protein [Gluconacetobacter liquefaciens]|uniref:CBS domain-containing protein n=1 Tax=Gluconacetobacter liquefaciens TaxID=89584 RepID=A0A370G758_GLULI|nr:CBS domain-containing protein [Gluconacetobacter liquefaciens]MBB2186682.1 CBS domain-containing protein [Gluconacetobacter liquefaciens]RDI38354.1 CBS domain-containing protein [Gluconacetobacter liquefaciens]GBQ93148.1 putative cystathionine-beta-synthase O [Gluconacetobacter liquefaciens NRIC 0522]GEB36587.1 signal transduction protein [Gluconacetobacter liquefaciens]
MSIPVLHILNDKGPAVITVGVEEPVTAIARLLAERHIGAVPVVDAAGHLAGMVSERSIVDALAHHGAQIEGLTARDIMTREVPTATRSEDIHSVARKMTRRHSRHVPVLDGSGHLVGLVSIGDIVKMRLEEAESLAREMRAYVMQEGGHASVPPQPFAS